MARRTKIANAMGWLSIALSLLYWLLLFLGSARHHFQREQFMMGLKAFAYLWNPIWALALLLAILAIVMGSRRWALAALIPVCSLLISWSLLASVPF